MRRILATLAALMVVASAREVRLAWNPAPAGTTVTVYLQGAAAPTVLGSTTQSEITVTVPDHEVSLTATIRNDFDESAHSDPVTIAAVPAPPSGLTRRKISLQSSIDLKTWDTIAVFEPPDAGLPSQFFRLELTL